MSLNTPILPLPNKIMYPSNAQKQTKRERFFENLTPPPQTHTHTKPFTKSITISVVTITSFLCDHPKYHTYQFFLVHSMKFIVKYLI